MKSNKLLLSFLSIVLFAVLFSLPVIYSVEGSANNKNTSLYKLLIERPHGSCDGSKMCRHWRRYAKYLENHISEYNTDVAKGCISFSQDHGAIDNFLVTHGDFSDDTMISCSRREGLSARDSSASQSDPFDRSYSIQREYGSSSAGPIYTYTPTDSDLHIFLADNMFATYFRILVTSSKRKFTADIDSISDRVEISFHNDGSHTVHSVPVGEQAAPYRYERANLTNDQINIMKTFTNTVIDDLFDPPIF